MKERRVNQKITTVNRKIEYSKVIVAICGLVGIYLVGFTSYVVIYTGDTSPLAYLIPAAFTAISAALGFYFNKAKLENKLKILKSEGKDIYKDLMNLPDEPETNFEDANNF